MPLSISTGSAILLVPRSRSSSAFVDDRRRSRCSFSRYKVRMRVSWSPCTKSMSLFRNIPWCSLLSRSASSVVDERSLPCWSMFRLRNGCPERLPLKNRCLIRESASRLCKLSSLTASPSSSGSFLDTFVELEMTRLINSPMNNKPLSRNNSIRKKLKIFQFSENFRELKDLSDVLEEQKAQIT